jgi:hypothetical protein
LKLPHEEVHERVFPVLTLPGEEEMGGFFRLCASRKGGGPANGRWTYKFRPARTCARKKFLFFFIIQQASDMFPLYVPFLFSSTHFNCFLKRIGAGLGREQKGLVQDFHG